MCISEPSTLLTDYVLGAAALAVALRLGRAALPGDPKARRSWAAAFAVGTAAAMAGGTVHGFAASLPPPWRAALWAGTMLASALAGTLLLAGAVCHALRGSARSLSLAALALTLAAELGWLWGEPWVSHVAAAAAVKIAGLLALVAWRGRVDAGPFLPVALGLVLAGTAIAVQRAGLSLDAHFNHNDVSHVLLTAALWPFYRAGLRL